MHIFSAMLFGNSLIGLAREGKTRKGHGYLESLVCGDLVAAAEAVADFLCNGQIAYVILRALYCRDVLLRKRSDE